jgi:hypothetical protein
MFSSASRKTADCAFNIFGHRYLLTHGDSLGTKGGDGIIGALGPIMRGTLKTHRSEAQIGRDFDTLLIGHWHQYITLPGSSSTTASRATTSMRTSSCARRTPTIAGAVVHPPRARLTAHWQVYLEKQLQALTRPSPGCRGRTSLTRGMPPDARSELHGPPTCARFMKSAAFGRLIAGPVGSGKTTAA